MSRDVVYITDKGYFMPTLVSMKSLIISAGTTAEYHIYCICDGLTVEQKQMMRQIETEQVHIHLLDKNEVCAERSLEGLKKHDCPATPTALLKFDLADVFENKDRILYIDGDTIIKGDLQKIFDIDLTGYYVAAVPDYAAAVLAAKRFREKPCNSYFNSGVMLLNLKKMRQENMCEVLYQKKFSSTDTTLMDQDTFNEVFGGNVICLPLKYNYMHSAVIRTRYFKGLSLETLNLAYGENYQSWDEVLSDADIVHFGSKEKPWKYQDVLCVDLWDSVYRQTPLSGQPLKRRKLQLKFLFGLCKFKHLRLLAKIIWDCEVFGLRKALRQDTKKLWKRLMGKSV